jgi:hypothetical protein
MRRQLDIPMMMTQMGGGFHLPFSVDFTGLTSVPAPFAGANLSIAAGKLIVTPTLGANLLINPTFTSWTTDNPNSWSATESPPTTEISEVGTGEGHGGAGTGMCNVYSSDGTFVVIWQTVLTAGLWYWANLVINTVVAGGISLIESNANAIKDYTTAASPTITFPSLSGASPGRFDIRRLAGGAADVTIDNTVVKAITTTTLLAAGVPQTNTPNVIVKAGWTLTADLPAGTIARLDSTSNPQNFLLACHDRTNARLYKCVSGTYTKLVDAAAAYSAGADVEIRCNGETVQLYYNDVQIGADQTVSDAALLDGGYNLPWSTSAANACGSFSIAPF